MDDTAESDIWYPHGVTFPPGAEYPPMQAHSTSCFVKMCGLAEILNQILVNIYDPLRQISDAEFRNCITQQEKNLDQWWDELPDFLRLVAGELPPYCPPSHIVTLKLVCLHILTLALLIVSSVAVYITRSIFCCIAQFYVVDPLHQMAAVQI